MLQEVVDSPSTIVERVVPSRAKTTDLSNLSDSLKGKQGRFRQNLLGKRVGLFSPFGDCGRAGAEDARVWFA